jgi:hypothetical protein
MTERSTTIIFQDHFLSNKSFFSLSLTIVHDSYWSNSERVEILYNVILYYKASSWGIKLDRYFNPWLTTCDYTIQLLHYDGKELLWAGQYYHPVLSWRRDYLISAVRDTLCGSPTHLRTGTHEPVTSQGRTDTTKRRGALASANKRKSIASAVRSAASTSLPHCASH